MFEFYSTREDLQYWVAESKNGRRNNEVQMDDPDTVQATLAGIKAQQQRIVGALQYEQDALEEDLRIGMLII